MNAEPVLVTYFRLLDARDIDGLLRLWHPEGVMITRGGTEGRPVAGASALRTFYEGRGPATARHRVTATAETGTASFAEGIVEPLGEGPVKFFLAGAVLDDERRLARYTTLVWPEVDSAQLRNLLAPLG